MNVTVSSESSRVSILRLYRTENVGPVGYKQLLQKFGTADAALEAIPELARRGGQKKPKKIPSLEKIKREIYAGESLGAQLVTYQDSVYSKYLLHCNDAPPILWCRGHTHLLEQPCFAIVGARNASANSKGFASSIAQRLSDNDFVIASGMARGIDAAVHQGCMRGRSGTIAVLAGGVDNIYPEQNTDLYKSIIIEGLVISEAPVGMVPVARHFPRRNRLISGLSLGVLVVEAERRSGSLITARFASEQGRLVFSMPGHPLDSRAYGTNDLIRNGATLVQTADDILVDILPLVERPLSENNDEYSSEQVPMMANEVTDKLRKHIISLLGPTPTQIDHLIRYSECSVSEVHGVLLELELAGRLERYSGQMVSLSTMDEEIII